jgi:hypothetical protein
LAATSEVSWLNNRIADSFYLLHIFITFFCAIMWLGPYEWMWWGVFILYGMTEICWFFRDGYCILTDLERRFRNISRADTALDQNFIKRVLYQFFRINIDPLFASKMTKLWGLSGWIIASLRIFIL